MRIVAFVLAVLIASTTVVVSAPLTAKASQPELFFVSSVDELGQLEGLTEPARGLAISVDFYRSVSPRTQRAIITMAQHYLSLKFRPVFIYGSGLDDEITQILLGQELACKPALYASIFHTTNAEGKDEVVIHCALGSDKPETEDGWRKQITESWLWLKQVIKEWDLKVLND